MNNKAPIYREVLPNHEVVRIDVIGTSYLAMSISPILGEAPTTLYDGTCGVTARKVADKHVADSLRTLVLEID